MLSKINKIGKLALAALIATAIASTANAGDYKTEARVQRALERSQAAIHLMRGASQERLQTDLVRLKSTAREVLSAHRLLEKKFKRRSEIVKDIGPKAVVRHEQMMERYKKFMRELEDLLAAENLTPDDVEKLRILLEGATPRRNRPIYGSLPYKHMNWPAREPLMSPVITPAYKGGNTQVTVEDTASTPEAPISSEIAELAESLEWSPVKIYEYVKNSVETEWYYGCMKGAVETLRQGSGNDCDQATLLVALLRASGYPTRYVRGVIEFFPDIETAKNLTGVSDAALLGEFFQKAGIPFRQLVAGGKINNYQIEHIWVETRVPYDNYRGVVVEELGKAWLGLDTSIKAAGYAYNDPADIPDGFHLSQIRDYYLQADRLETPMEYLRAEMDVYLDQNQPELSYADLLRTRSLNPEELKILPASLQFEQVAVTNEYTSIPDELIHKARFMASDWHNNVLFDVTLDTLDLSNQSIAVYYEPETVEDQEIINSFGGLDNTPAYLVRLRPVLKVNGERLAVASDGLTMGSDAIFVIELVFPGGVERLANDIIIGNLAVVGLVAQDVVALASIPSEEKTAERLLYEESLIYIDKWNVAEGELSSLLHVSHARPLPSVVTMGGIIEVTYLLDMPHGYEWKGAFVDADHRSIEVTCGTDALFQFMQISALHGSVLEDRILREDFLVESISTARLLALAQSNQIPLLIIDWSNIASLLPILPFAENVKEDITNSVFQGMIVKIPDREVTFEDWTGVGYIKENPATGESGWMLSGMIAGGMSAWGLDKWPEYYLERLINPYTEPPNYDPLSGHSIQKIAAYDMQFGTVGKPLKKRLRVIVRDENHMPVKGVPVTFTILAGGGTLFRGEPTTTVHTKYNGIASVNETVLGTKTSDNPVFIWEEGYTYHQQVGQNIIDASLPSGVSIKVPFTAFGFPDMDSLELTKEQDVTYLVPDFYAGFIEAFIKDQYGNPVSNVPITFYNYEYFSGLGVNCPGDTCEVYDPCLPYHVFNCQRCPFYTENWPEDWYWPSFVQLDDPCMDGIPSRDTCSTSSIETIELTSPWGIRLHVLNGTCGSVTYVINAQYGEYNGEDPQIVNYQFNTVSKIHYGCNDVLLHYEYIYHENELGQTADAASSGKDISLPLNMWFYDQEADELNYTTWITTTEFVDPTYVLFNDIPAIREEPHRFVGTYNVLPGLNNVHIKAVASLARDEYPFICTREVEMDVEVYGVDFLTESIYYIQVDDDGYAVYDDVVEYDIIPPEYQALDAYVEIQKNGVPIQYIMSEKQGHGSVTMSRGLQYDLDSTYEAQIVLNIGTRVEVRSEKIELKVVSTPLSVEKTPFVLQRKHHNAEFETSDTQLSSYTDDFKVINFALLAPATVSINLLDEDKSKIATLVQEMEITSEQVENSINYAFVVDYEAVRQHVHPVAGEYNFYVQIEAEFPNGQETETTKEEIPGRLSEVRQGFMLGTIVAHDVLIADGSLTLTREDLTLKGRGPDLSFLRSYSNRGPVRGDGPLGGGWNHNFDKRVTVLRSNSMQDGPIPQWVVGLKQTGIFSADAVPTTPENWNQISINGAQFRKVDGEWQVERGRRSKLVQEGEEYVFTSLDGTRYYFGIPDDFPYYEFPSARFQDEGPASGQCQDKSRLRRIVDRNGNELNLTYDALCQIREIEDAVGRRLKFHYQETDSNYFGKLSVIERVELMDQGQEENGIEVVRFSYNDEGFLERAEKDVTFQSIPDNAWYERYEYDRERPDDSFDYNLVATLNAKDERFLYEYHQPGEIGYTGDLYGAEMKDEDVVKSVSYPAAPDIHTATFDYDFNQKDRTVTDLRGNPTTYTLNEFGNPLQIEEPTVDDGAALVTTLQWSLDHGLPGNDLISRSVTNVIDQISEVRTSQFTYQYNENTRVETRQDPYGNEVVTVFDSNFNVPLTRTDRNANTESWSYDQNGNLLVYTDADQKTTTYTYNSFGERETKTLQGNATSTTYTYDSYGNLDTVTEPEGSSRDLDHDLWGRLVRNVDPHGNAIYNRYDSIGRLREVEHQPQNLADIIAPVSQHLELIRTIEYDPAGNKTLETDLNGLELHYTYTARGQVDTIQRRDGGTTHGQKSFQYDPNGNVLSETDWLGRPTSHTYDQRNRRRTTTNRLSRTMSIEYDTVGNLLQVADFEGNVTSYTYDLLDREVSRTVLGDGGGTIGRTYYKEEDSRKNLKTITDQAGKTTTYEYNGRYLITRIIDPLQADKGGLTNPDKGHRIEYDAKGNKVGETDSENNLTNYEYDQENRLTATERLKKEGGSARTSYDYSNYISSKMVVETDPLGKAKQTFYDPWNRVKKIVDADAYDRESWYDGEGSIVLMRDGRGLTRRWERDRRGLVQSYYDAVAVANPTYRYEYSNNDKLTRKFRIREVGGEVGYVETETQYDAEDREQFIIEAKVLPEERRLQYVSRDGMGNPLEILDYNGNKTTYEYNAIYKVKKELDNRYKAIEYEYYPTGRLYKKIDKRIALETRTTTYEYDLLDREKRVEDPLGQSTQKTYDDVGNPLTVTDKRGIVTEHEYDSLYRRTRTVRAGQQVERKVYNDVGNVTAEYDAYDRLVRGFEYNNRHLLSKTVFHNDADVTTNEQRQYDGNGNLTTLIDEEGKPTTYTYDAENRQLTATFEGETTAKQYDKIGNLVALALPEGAPGAKFAGKHKAYVYDAHNQLIRAEEEDLFGGAGGFSTRYGYDPNGNLRHIYDPLDNHVEYVYDDLDRRTQHIQHKYAGNLVTQFGYDNVGNLTNVTDAKGQYFIYAYDLLNRRIDATYPEVPSPLLRLAHIDFDYDPNSNLKSVTERKYQPDGTEHIDVISNIYDNFDRLDDSTRRGVLIDYTYDQNGNRLSVSTPNHSTSYTYMLRNWLKTATLGGQTTTFNYLPDGKIDLVTYPNGMEADYTYHPTNRIQSITHTNSSVVIYSYAYTYDKNGNRMAQEEFNDGITETTDYAYDPMNRLTAYTITGHAAPFMREYTHEGYNRKTETTYEDGDEVDSKTYNYDQTNWLTQVAGDTYDIDYTYDNNGNTLTKVDSRTPNDPISFQYSARDRLVQVKKGLPGSEAILGQYDYNHEGNRVRHRHSDRGDVDYYYDDGAVLEERNASDDSLLAYYQYADRLIALAQPLGRQYYHHDALGSTIGLTDQNGADKKSYHLDPWGNIRWETGTSDNRRIFTGKEHDKNTGLVYFGARYYDPEIGRFITQDTYLGQSNEPPSLHRYLYAHSNPTVYVDQEGRFAMAGMAGVALDQYYSQWSGSRGPEFEESDLTEGEVYSGPLGISGPGSKEVSFPPQKYNIEEKWKEERERKSTKFIRFTKEMQEEPKTYREMVHRKASAEQLELQQLFNEPIEVMKKRIAFRGQAPTGSSSKQMIDLVETMKAISILTEKIPLWDIMGQSLHDIEVAKIALSTGEGVPEFVMREAHREFAETTLYKGIEYGALLYGGLKPKAGAGRVVKKVPTPAAKAGRQLYTKPSIQKIGVSHKAQVVDTETGHVLKEIHTKGRPGKAGLPHTHKWKYHKGPEGKGRWRRAEGVKTKPEDIFEWYRGGQVVGGPKGRR